MKTKPHKPLALVVLMNNLVCAEKVNEAVSVGYCNVLIFIHHAITLGNTLSSCCKRLR